MLTSEKVFLSNEKVCLSKLLGDLSAQFCWLELLLDSTSISKIVRCWIRNTAEQKRLQTAKHIGGEEIVGNPFGEARA
jgi:hypothetical protein